MKAKATMEVVVVMEGTAISCSAMVNPSVIEAAAAVMVAIASSRSATCLAQGILAAVAAKAVTAIKGFVTA